MSTQHTPGPWILSRHGAVIGGVTRQYTNGVGQDQIAMACHMQDGNGDQHANARLIAAAPDLLEALECLMVECDLVSEDAVKAYANARAAIAKALGEKND